MITIIRYGFSDVPKMAILKARLEAEGIHVYQSDDFGMYKRRVSSFHLDIASSQLSLAEPILKELGYYNKQEPLVLDSVYHWSTRIPVIRSIPEEYRVFTLIIIASIFITIILVAIFI